MLDAFRNVARIPELRKKILVTAALLAVFRFGIFVPCPGIDTTAITGASESGESPGNRLMDLADMFAGGALKRMSVFGTGIMPYITASIVFQLLAAVVPALQKISKEGESGRKRLTQYQRYATVMLCIFWGTVFSRKALADGVVLDNWAGWQFTLFAIVSMTAGTMFLMWLGEQIDEFGIGSGISLIIMVGIISRLPLAIRYIQQNFKRQLGVTDAFGPDKVVALGVLFVVMVVVVVVLTQAQRRVPVHTARRTRQGYSARSYVPLRVNMAGVISIIFAGAVMIIPNMLVRAGVMPGLTRFIDSGTFLYYTLYMFLIVFFTYFYTAIVFNPLEQAENFKQYGTFIPGIRPGRKTADYLQGIMNRVTLPGAVTLAAIAVLPQVVQWKLKVPAAVAGFFGGTGLLIVVGVALDVVQRMESYMVMQHYGGFLEGGGRIRGRR